MAQRMVRSGNVCHLRKYKSNIWKVLIYHHQFRSVQKFIVYPESNFTYYVVFVVCIYMNNQRLIV